MNFKLLAQFLLRAGLVGVIIACVIPNISNAQQGAFLISKHSPSANNNLYFDLTISKEGNTFIASKNGIIKYNGNQNKIIDTGGAVLSIVNSSENIIYAGGVGGFGFITSEGYSESYQPILKQANIVIVDMYYLNNEVYAISESVLFKYNIITDSISQFTDEMAGHFYQVFEIGNRILVSTVNKGVLELISDQLVTTDMELIQDIDVNFVDKSPDSSKYIISTYSNELFIYDGILKPLKINDDFINRNNISCAVWYDDDHIAVGTTFGGLAIINTSQQKLINEINFNFGLEANDIKAVTVDNNGSILSLSDNLIEYISINIPIKNFTNYDGLEGASQAIAYFNNKLYVGSDRGLFSLNKIDNFEERSYAVQSILQHRPNTIEKKSKKRLSRKRRKSKKTDDPITVIDSVIIKLVKQQVLLSSHYQYQRVEDINHCNQIITRKNSLIASGLSGVYEITKNGIIDISKTPAFYTYLSEDNRLIFACGNNQILTFHKVSGKWVQKDILTDLRENISHIIEFKGSYWLCGTDEIHKLTIERNELMDAEIYAISNPYFDEVYGFTKQNSLYFVSKNNHYILNNDSIISDIKNVAELVALDNHNNLWVKESNRWYQPQNDLSNPLFSAINNIAHVFVDNETLNYWMLSNDQKILRFNQEDSLSLNKYLPYLDVIYSNEAQFIDASTFEVKQQNSELSFQVAHPDFAKLENTLYRHRLKGLNTDWSAWSTNDLIEFPFLPAGEYELEIEAKNSFGNIHKLLPISFNVIPPYWKEPIFYLFEFLVITLLLIISIKIRSWGSHFEIVSRLLAFLVLAVILEGVEAILESKFNLESSPFFSFSLQVITALILFPLEGVFRKYVLLEKKHISMVSKSEEKNEKFKT